VIIDYDFTGLIMRAGPWFHILELKCAYKGALEPKLPRRHWSDTPGPHRRCRANGPPHLLPCHHHHFARTLLEQALPDQS